jgi:hypothetical protein
MRAPIPTPEAATNTGRQPMMIIAAWAGREWINFIIAIIVMWLLTIVAIHDLELVSVPDQWRLN